MSDPARSYPDQDPEERLAVLHQLEDWVQTPMVVLSFVWLLLVLVEFVWGASKLLETFGIAIWIVFLAEFALRFALAPDKLLFLRSNIITIFALAVPAFRLLRSFRLLRLARAARSLRLVKIIGAANRGMGALRASLGRRGLGYVLAFTVFVTLLGAAGMLAFESASRSRAWFLLLSRRPVVDRDAADHHGLRVLAPDAGGAATMPVALDLWLCGLRLYHG